MIRILPLLPMLLAITLSGQEIKPTIEDALTNFNFTKGEIIEGKDSITYYLKANSIKPNKLVVFIQGTDANPIFSYKIKNGKPVFYRWFVDDYKNLDDSYAYAIIPKPGMEGLYKDEKVEIPKEYYEKNYREYRVKQIDRSINDIIKNHISVPEKVIVYGHSEGAVIAAALSNVNKQITHLGFWSGNVLNNFYEFSLFNRIETLQGKQSNEDAHNNIMGIIGWYQSVITNPNSTELDHFGFTNKRWSSYERPPIDDLLALDIPVYAMFGTNDQSTPIETAYLLPIQFMENRKTNLDFNVCMNCSHSYTEEVGEETINHWDRIFGEFMRWTEKEY